MTTQEIRSEVLRIAARLTRTQFDHPADLDLPKNFGRKRYVKLYKKIEDFNESVKRISIELKTVYDKMNNIESLNKQINNNC